MSNLGIVVECIDCGNEVCVHQQVVIRRQEARVRELEAENERLREKVEAHERWWDDETGDTYYIAICEATTNDGDPCPVRPWVTEAEGNDYCEGGNPDYREPDTGAHIDCSHPTTRCKVLKLTGAALRSPAGPSTDEDKP